jgi:hypothetical protein
MIRRREFITLLGGPVSMFLCVSAVAQEGHYGVGHDKWHQGFYSTLKRNDGGGSCSIGSIAFASGTVSRRHTPQRSPLWTIRN